MPSFTQSGENYSSASITNGSDKKFKTLSPQSHLSLLSTNVLIPPFSFEQCSSPLILFSSWNLCHEFFMMARVAHDEITVVSPFTSSRNTPGDSWCKLLDKPFLIEW
ncbi:hypothetical protein CDAR_293461 [Caerostris darwini]|uniref:Uncharacterized protein n=1 Tax=Caerostris darwini TaxID=1538125 RepID=A0AAV4RJG9_9ARAC|nr:hypothetical protein CDAR_293461 [Caerostris darwini]